MVNRKDEKLNHEEEPEHRYASGKPYRLPGGHSLKRGALEDRTAGCATITGEYSADEYLAKVKQQMKIQFYSQNSIKNYLSHLRRFLNWYGREPHLVHRADVCDYLELLVDGGASSDHVAVCLSALRLALDKYSGRNVTEGLATPRRPRRKPMVLSQKEVLRILAAAPTTEMKLAIGIMYAAGLRNSEVCRLKLADFDFERNTILIRRGKGQSDRLVMLPATFRDLLSSVCDQHGLASYLFPSRSSRKNRHISPRTLGRWVERVVCLAGIGRRVTPHSFRHAFATHMLEAGTDIRFIQRLLGHQRLETTTIYTHVAQLRPESVISPIDRVSFGSASESLTGKAAMPRDRQDHHAVNDANAESQHDQPSPRGDSGQANVSVSGPNSNPLTFGKDVAVHMRMEPCNREAKVTLQVLNVGKERCFLLGTTIKIEDDCWLRIEFPDKTEWASQLSQLRKSTREIFGDIEFYEAIRSRIANQFWHRQQSVQGVGSNT